MAGVGYFTVGSNKLEAAKAFYDELLGSIGMKPRFEHPLGGRLYSNRVAYFRDLDGNNLCGYKFG